MTYCAGIIVWRKREDGQIEFFLCSPGGPQWANRECWNFPKGEIDTEKDETNLDCVIREFKEETGTDVIQNGHPLIYQQLVKQRADKCVHVIAKEWDGEKLDETCFSNTFVWTDGKEYPEIGKYAWMTLDELKQRGGIKKYYSIFEDLIKRNT